MLVAGEHLLHGEAASLGRALLVVGFLCKLGALPLFFWLPRLADDLPAPVLGLVVAVVDVAAFGELWSIAQATPSLCEPRALWVGVAAATSLGGAVLMLAQRDLKRLLVLSTVEDVGFLLLGVASMSSLGVTGALTGATVHALAKALLFVCLTAPEADGALGEGSAGLATRYPASAAGFVVGSLVVLGVPPTLGFAARWRLYATASQLGAGVLAIFAVASALALIAYALAVSRVFFGPAPAGAPATAREPVRVKVTVATLAALLVLTGLWPTLLSLVTWSVR
jgi:formate hydrogenlyase subunit 3/multisubunit Na+/H+ antiporter MnhD subunit